MLLAAGTRLQYRTLRCASACFAEVHVYGTAEARALALSRLCRSFTAMGVTADRIDGLSLDALGDLCSRLGIDCLLPSDGATTRFLAMHRDSIPVPTFPVPSVEALEALDDKHNFALLCHRLGLPHPRVRLMATSDDLVRAVTTRTLALPAIVKPLRMWGSYGVAKLDAHNAEKVARAIDYAPILVQDFVEGRDLSAFFVCRAGTIVASAAYEKSRAAIRFFRLDEVDAWAARVAEHFRFDGVIGFDLRMRPDGSVVFLECNPRFWYSMDATMSAGLNFVEIGLDIDRAPATGSLVLDGVRIARSGALIDWCRAPWRHYTDLIDASRQIARDAPIQLVMFAQSRWGKGRLSRGRSF